MLSQNKDGLYECAVCHNFVTDNGKSLSIHVNRVHQMDAKSYYDEYCKTDGEGCCKVCGNPVRFKSLVCGYRDTCSTKCMWKLLKDDPVRMAERTEKTKATCMDRYGTTNGGASKMAQEKAQCTNLKRRGVKFVSQDPAVKAKTKETCQIRYGATTYIQSERGAQAIRNTNMQKYGREYFFAGEEGKKASRDGYRAKHGVDHNMHDPVFLEKWKEYQMAANDGKYFVQTDEFREKSKKTQFAKYGNWYSATEVGRAKYRATILGMYGVDEYFRSEDFKTKAKTTILSKYNVDNYAKTDEWHSKVNTTCQAKYGALYVTQTQQQKEKSRITCMQRYGVPNYAMTDECQQRISETTRSRYGVDRIAQSAEGRQKMADTMAKRYGDTCYASSSEFRKIMGERYEELLKKVDCEIIAVDGWFKVRYHCNVCGTDCTEQAQFIRHRIRNNISPCTTCVVKNPPVSIGETEVRSYVESLGCDVSHYDVDFLGKLGADIVIESNKIIIEYDGLYWHSELYKPKNYHLLKKLLAEDKGYRLIHIFSDEWAYKKDIVKSRLRYLLGKMKSTNRLYARECEVGYVAPHLAREFLERNHIQGNVNASARYGLFKEGTLVSLMTFGKSRFEPGVTELLRFCSDKDINVVGGAGKLFNAFVKDHPDVDHIVSYADARWSTSHAFYEKLGFVFTAMSNPGYSIVDGDVRKNRMQYQRHKIARPVDEGKTEHEITLELGLYRIYDCGQYRYDWTRNDENCLNHLT